MQNVFDLIEKYQTITIFRHINADFDAMGAQFGLKQFICDTYPNKNVYALGDEVGSCASHFPAIDSVSDEVIKNSLAIILDCANASRIDDQRYAQADYRIKIDHHVFADQYADLEIIQDNKGATCEILTQMFMDQNIKVSKLCATYLYRGLIADTISFSIPATTANTLKVAAYLIEQGIDVASINESNFSKNFNEFAYETYIRSHAKVFKGKILYAKISKAEYEKFQLDYTQAKDKVNVFSRIDTIPIWALFVESNQEDEQLIYSGSLRSKQVNIRDIATRFNGGGHLYACGVKNLYDEDIELLLQALYQVIQ